jgi:glycosyltransferase involved in cell wall biosynthesis
LLATGLDRERYEPIVVLPSAGELADDLRAASVEVIVRPLCVLRREFANPRGLASLVPALVRDATALRELAARRGVGIVHSNTSVALGGAAAAGLARLPHIWHVREIYARFGRAWPLYRRLLLTARALPCVSRATASQFDGSSRTVVIPDGLAVDVRRPPRDVARRTLGIDVGAPVIAVLGRISDWKGQDVLVRALADPALRERGTVGLIAGHPWPGAEDRLERVMALADSLGVSDRVRLVGFRADVENVYGAADVVAVPSTEPDPLPGAAIEAAAAGCAVIASAHGGLPEIIRDGETGRLMPPRDAVTLARVAAELFDDAGQRQRLGAAAADDVRRRFAPARYVEAVESLYETVSRSRHRSA